MSKIGLSVRLRQGDLMLCDSCNNYRFPEVAVARAPQINTELCQKSDELAVKRRDAAQSECPPSVRTDSKRVAEVNELLCFLHNKYHHHPLSLVKNAVIDFCHEDEILAAEQILVQHVSDKSLIQQYTRRRIGENKKNLLWMTLLTSGQLWMNIISSE